MGPPYACEAPRDRRVLSSHAAWNNLGDAHEARKDWDAALQAYQASLAVDPNNGVAKSRSEAMKTRLSRLDPREGGFSA